jgi:hypothetical protein
VFFQLPHRHQQDMLQPAGCPRAAANPHNCESMKSAVQQQQSGPQSPTQRLGTHRPGLRERPQVERPDVIHLRIPPSHAVQHQTYSCTYGAVAALHTSQGCPATCCANIDNTRQRYVLNGLYKQQCTFASLNCGAGCKISHRQVADVVGDLKQEPEGEGGQAALQRYRAGLHPALQQRLAR